MVAPGPSAVDPRHAPSLPPRMKPGIRPCHSRPTCYTRGSRTPLLFIHPPGDDPMRRVLTLLVILALLAPAAVLAHYTHGVGDAFAVVHAGSEDGPALQDEGLYLVAELSDGYLAFIDDHELAHLRAQGIAVDVLVEKDDESLEYLIVHDHGHAGDPGHEHAEPHPAAALLHRGPGYRIMSVPAEILEAQPNCVPELQRVFRRPLSFVRTPWPDPPLAMRSVTVDPDLAAAIAGITEGPLQSQVQTLQDFQTRHSEYIGGELASYWIRDTFLSYGYLDVTLQDYNDWNDNVVCVKPGAVFPDEYIVIGAHYDSINYADNSDAPGADDNASGTVGVLEAARVLRDIEFERTIVFIAFSGEEQGLVGSDVWASEAADAGLDVVGMVNLDMICYTAPGDTEDLDIISNSASAPMADLAFETIDAYVPELTAVEGFLTSGSSDHASFWANGFRALFFFEDSGDYSPYLHTSSDVVGLSANDFPFMVKNVKAAAAVTGVLARPFHVALAHEPLDHTESTGPFPVTAEVVSAEPLDEASLELRYRIDGGGFTSLPLVPTGSPDEYGATIPATAPGSQVEYYLTASDVDGFTTTSPDDAPVVVHSFRTGITFAFTEDGEGDQGWQLGAPGDDATTGQWILADPVGTAYQPEDDHTPDPGVRCFVTGNADPGDPSGANDVDGGRTTLTSPVFDLSGATWASLSYWRWYTVETTLDDEFTVSISNDGGASWQVLEVVDQTEVPWTRAEFEDLGGIIPLTGQMRLRFVAEDTGGGSLVEALIDDLQVVTTAGDVTAADRLPAPVASLDARPNPFNPRTSFAFTLPRAGRAEIRLYDATGREVARPLVSGLPAGTHVAEFDGTRLASGVYLVRLVLDGEALASSKVTLLK
ncbi:M20/M25/M40 family metallo-hydrolase [bacterium]|nr:M20/M25/M40 family metallo-hydrolase [bacterium]